MHYKTVFTLGFALCCCVGLASGKTVGSGHLATETRAIAGAHGVDLATIGDLTVTQGDKEELVVEAEDNLVPLFVSDVNADGVLVIHTRENDIRPTKPVTFRLTVRHLDCLVLSGSGSIHADRLAAGHAQVRLPGSGDITVAQVDSGELAVKLEGSGNVKLAAGTARHQTLDLTGSGSYGASGLACDDARVSISGSGDAKVRASATLDVQISGSGEVSYAGDPKLTKHISGSGEISRM